MIERKEILQESGATLVRPLFDEAATESARPVIPLAAGAGGAPPERRSQAWALVLGSAIAGSALGIIGVSLYQQRRIISPSASAQTAPTPAPTSPESSPTPAEFSPNVAAVVESPEPSPEPSEEEPEPAEKAEKIPEPTPTASTARRDARGEVKKPSEALDDEKRDRESPDKEETRADTAREQASEGDADEPTRSETRPRRARDVERDVNANDQTDEEDEPGPRRIDRVRDIFTGGDQPQREERRRERLRRRGERLPEDTP